MAVLTTHVQRRYKDLDPLGHVNNVVYLDYLQEARLRALQQIGHLEIENFGQVMAHQSIDYRQPVYYSTEPLVIEVWVSSIGNTSYRMKYRILNDNGDVAAEAESVMVCFDSGSAITIPSELRKVLEAIAEVGQ